MAGLPSNTLFKTNSISSQNSAPTAQIGPFAGGDNNAQRRPGGSGSFGAGLSSRSAAVARNKQTSRNQGKQSRRYNRVSDEDAVDEAVSPLPD